MSQNLVEINVRETSATQQHDIGTRYVMPGDEDQRIYRYTLAGATALDPGKLVVNSDVDSDVVNKTVARTYAAGTREIIIDSAGAVTADEYRGGTLAISDATGEGVLMRVSGNTALSGAGELTVYLKEPCPVALTIDVSEATLLRNPWYGVVISATDQADMPVGIPNVTIAANEYGWVQTRGECAGWADEAFAKGAMLTIGTGTAGQIEALDAAGEPLVGVAMEAAADTEYRAVYLQID
jgi:hypothetical protein